MTGICWIGLAIISYIKKNFLCKKGKNGGINNELLYLYAITFDLLFSCRIKPKNKTLKIPFSREMILY